MPNDAVPGGDDELDPELAAAFAVEGPEGNRALYASWAATYDQGFVTRTGYVYHDRVAEIFVAGLDPARPTGPVLDIGCGTGNVGLALRHLGVGVVDGIDLSPEMLAQAAGKRAADGPVYRQLIEADLTGQIAVPSGAYGGLVSAGAFTHGHLGPGSIDELLRVAAPEARVVIGVNGAHFHQHGFGDWFEAAQGAGRIANLELVAAAIYQQYDPGDLNRVAQVAVFTRP